MRSAIPAAVFGVALLLLLLLAPGCGREMTGPERAAEDAWKLYDSEPGARTYENFVNANRMAAGKHASPHDRKGIEYQVRALEVMSREAERAKDLGLADEVVEAVARIDERDLAGVYDETFPGAKKRLEEAKARAAAVSR